MPTIKSMGWRKGKNGINYLELSLFMERTKGIEWRLTLREEDASKMYLKVNSGILMTTRSIDYVLPLEEAERQERDKNKPENLPGNKSYSTKVNAEITYMHLEDSKLYEYYFTMLRILDYDGIASVQIEKTFANSAEVLVGDKVRLEILAPLR